MAKNLVSVEWVRDHLQDPQVRIVDCRFVLGQPEAGKTAYEEGHIPGAFYMDLEKDLSAPKQAHGGRHPLPDSAELSHKLGEIGIDNTVTVVAYDDQGGAMASRFWWVLQYLGHSDVQVMDGGFSQWKEKGYPVTAEIPQAEAREFTPNEQTEILLSMEDVRNRIGKPGTVIIDAREAKRFKGIEEATDPVAGHIPSAVNYFWKDNLTEAGLWKSTEELKKRFADVSKEDEIVVYCGSGVTACPNFLALKEAGYSNVKLYSGSWSDWITYSDNEIVVEK